MNFKIFFYNSLSGKLESFIPLEKDVVNMYVCGPTVYGKLHLGNCRSAVVFDVLYRFLNLFFQVNYVKNITDIDDKIIKKALDTNKEFLEIVDENIKFYQQDMQILNVLEPSHSPKATEYIDDMIQMIKQLITTEFAYEKSNHVFFNVEKFKDYGSLSNRTLEQMIAGSRIEINNDKINPADFVLWKPAKNNEPFWPSPWGNGRPGWHIECSAMINHFFGKVFDIHGGGCDLKFPHHENEIAQSQALFGQDSFAKTWLHNGMLTVDGQKMSKSAGNFIVLDKLLQQQRPETIRYVLLLAHYRQDCDFTNNALNQAKKTLGKIYNIWNALAEANPTIKNYNFEQELDILKNSGIQNEKITHYFVKGFVDALKIDLNVPKALSFLHNAIKECNKKLLAESHLQSPLSSGAKDLGLQILRSAHLLGLINTQYNNFSYYQRWSAQKVSKSYSAPASNSINLVSPDLNRNTVAKNNQNDNENAAATQQLTKDQVTEINNLINRRQEARKNKDFTTADLIRDQLYRMNIEIIDNKDGSISWHSLT